ncbi:MAG: hypothetical protein A3F17_05970 [Gammaproteobacteria bacterium RIFCSPHIGHO2_12_FULL_41_15]|nr:MAG: hypothetical protein A3F17_05970 [Gammaproteobacteria bacterium RIFCSPHIGHO2_12_FULL_41_15]
MKSQQYALLAFFLFAPITMAAKEIAITIDDLPYVGNANTPDKLRREEARFSKVLATLKAENVPATGFVVPSSIEKDQWALLEAFKQQGNTIANHTYSHPSLNNMSAEKYIQNIERADQILAPLMGKEKFFRYPFLATGNNCQKSLAVSNYLKQQGYTIAPVTIDAKDFNWNQRLHNVPWRMRASRLPYFKQHYLDATWARTKKAEQKTQEITGRAIPQIWLVHMNTLNSHFLGDAIRMYKQNGYRFVTLAQAMQDPFYRSEKVKLLEGVPNCQPKIDQGTE